MKKYLIVKNNIIVSIRVAFGESYIVLQDGEICIDITDDKKKYKKGQKYKTLWGRIWGT